MELKTYLIRYLHQLENRQKYWLEQTHSGHRCIFKWGTELCEEGLAAADVQGRTYRQVPHAPAVELSVPVNPVKWCSTM